MIEVMIFSYIYKVKMNQYVNKYKDLSIYLLLGAVEVKFLYYFGQKFRIVYVVYLAFGIDE